MAIRYCFLILLFFKAAYANDAFLTSGELQGLEAEQQKEYLESVRNIVVKMSEKSDYIADAFEDTEIRSTASTDSEVAPVTAQFLAANKMTLKELVGHINTGSKTPMNQRSTPEYKKSREIWFAYSNAVQVDRQNSARKAQHELRKAQFEAIKIEDKETLDKHRQDHQTFLKEQLDPNRKMPNEQSNFDKVIGSVKKAFTPSMPKEEAKSVEVSLTEETKPEPKKSFFRCLFAGWVVESDPCRGPNALPAKMVKELELNPKNAKCAAGEFACNPVLFGLKLPEGCGKLSNYLTKSKEYCTSLAEPLCAKSRSQPTLECKNLSTTTIDVAADINTRKNVNFYEEFILKFSQLCDQDQMDQNQMIATYRGKPRSNALAVMTDLNETCGWAVDQLDMLRKRMLTAVEDPCYDSRYNLDSEGNKLKCKKIKHKKKPKSQK